VALGSQYGKENMGMGTTSEDFLQLAGNYDDHDLYLMKIGEKGCPAGEEIDDATNCNQAVQVMIARGQLKKSSSGYPLRQVNIPNQYPANCAVRSEDSGLAAGTWITLFNKQSEGAGTKQHQPLCMRPKSGCNPLQCTDKNGNDCCAPSVHEDGEVAQCGAGYTVKFIGGGKGEGCSGFRDGRFNCCT